MPSNARKKERPKEWAAYMREYRKRRPDVVKHAGLRTRFGISKAEYDALLEKQNFVCAICELPETASIRGKILALAVDHCHDTGRIRGLLCMQCNRAIGGLRHDKALFAKAMAYLD